MSKDKEIDVVEKQDMMNEWSLLLIKILFPKAVHTVALLESIGIPQKMPILKCLVGIDINVLIDNKVKSQIM
jgi:hypothetical protein